MDFCLTLERNISRKENERITRCTHPTSDPQICIVINYSLWSMRMEHQKSCQNKTKIIKNAS
jgi:hypothetical protein